MSTDIHPRPIQVNRIVLRRKNLAVREALFWVGAVGEVPIAALTLGLVLGASRWQDVGFAGSTNPEKDNYFACRSSSEWSYNWRIGISAISAFFAEKEVIQ
jgi:hypothetical protein